MDRGCDAVGALSEIHQRLNDIVCGHRVVFHHVPKCGGTSVYRALRRHYFSSYADFDLPSIYCAVEALNPGRDEDWIRDETLRFRETQLLCYLYGDRRCVAGHVRFSDPAFDRFSPNYKFITTLREPVSLFDSTFFYNVTSREKRWKIETDVETFLATPRARLFGASYAHFYSGLPPDCDPLSREVIDRAKVNLAQFSVVGLTEDMPSFERRLRDALGIRLRIGHQNKARVTQAERTRTMTDEVKKKIEALNAVNIEIYEYAREHLAG
jgi:hypothetical protein